jgi:hypothetical protein
LGKKHYLFQHKDFDWSKKLSQFTFNGQNYFFLANTLCISKALDSLRIKTKGLRMWICGNECGCSVLSKHNRRSNSLLLSLNYSAKELANKSIADIIKSPLDSLFIVQQKKSTSSHAIFNFSLFIAHTVIGSLK